MTIEMKQRLDWSDLHKLGTYKKGGKWYPDERIAEYFRFLRAPSRAYPHSYSKAAQTLKFARWLVEHRPEIARDSRLSEGL